MNRLLVSAAVLLFGAIPGHAQGLVSGKVQTGTPSYVNDQNAPLSLDTTGALRVTGGSSGAASAGSVTPAGTSGSQAQAVQGINGGVPVPIQGGNATAVKTDGSGSTQPVSASSLPTASGVTRTRLTCTLPAYASGGNIVCTDQAGTQTTTACAANTACLVAAANASRKTAFATVRTAGVTCDIGYATTVAPGNAVGVDGPTSATGAQGGSMAETPAHVGAYYAACPATATLVYVQGQ